GYAKALASHEKIKQIALEQETAFKKDPYAYTQKSPSYNDIFKQFQETQDFNNYNNNIIAYQKGKGATNDSVRLLPEGQSAEIVSRVTQGSAKDGLMMLNGLREQYKDNFPTVMKGLTANGLSAGYQFAAEVSSIPQSQAYLPEYLESL